MNKYIFSIILLFIAGSGYSQITVQAVRVDEAPEIDGIPDEDIWELAIPVNEDFIQHRPDCGEPMSERTEIRLLFDDRALYVALTMHDSHPEEFTRALTPRDHDFSSEWIGVWLDTFNDDNNAYFFFTNIENVQQDGRLCEVGGWDSNWDAVWESATASSDSGWTAEYAIPFAVLRYSDDTEQVWGVNVKRTMTRTNESAFLFRMGDNGWIYIRDFGELHGLNNLPDSRRIELRPYGAGKIQYMPDSEDEWDPWGNAGLDCRIGISTNASLDLTINPDFGQIEADADEANLSHWETFLREKRPFFLEGADLFDLPFNLFYSRRIGAVASNGEIIPILGGAKLTGASGGFRFGLLEAYTGRISEDGDMLEPAANYSVGRVIREFGDGSFIGASMTSTDIPQQENQDYSYGRSGALDAQIRIADLHTLYGAFGGTWNSYAGEWSDNLAYKGTYSFKNERLNCSTGFSYREENFNANMIGYTTSTGDVNSWAEMGLFHPFSGNPTLQDAWTNICYYYDQVPGGEITSRGIRLNSGVSFRNRYYIEGGICYRGSRFDRYEGPDGATYDPGMSWNFYCSTDSRQKFYISLYVNGGTYRNGTNRSFGTWLNLKPAPHVSIGADIDWSTTSNALGYNWDSEAWDTRDTDWKSFELSCSYMFNTDLSLSLVSQISRFESDYGLSEISESNDHWMNILLSWQFKPGSMFYFMAGENADPDEITGEYGEPDFTVFSKLTWFLPI